MNILELLDGVIRKPAATFEKIAQEKPMGWALAVFSVSVLLGLVSTDYSELQEYIPLPASMAILQFIFSLVFLFIITGLLHLLSRIFKGSGDYRGLFSTLGFAQFPGFLVPIAQVIKGIGGTAGSILGNIISFGLSIWVLVLYVIAFRESHKITTGASILTYLLVLVVITVVVLIGVLILAFGLRGFLLGYASYS